jgi:hypothetical protein
MKKRFALVRRPRTKTPSQPKPRKPESKHIPHEVRRDVIARDGVQCSYVSAAGKRCKQQGFIELHHEEPSARGGQSTTSNIRTLCRAHNQLRAEQDFGRAFVQQRIMQDRTHRLEVSRPGHPGTSCQTAAEAEAPGQAGTTDITNSGCWRSAASWRFARSSHQGHP